MSRGARIAVSLILGFVVYRIAVEGVEPPSALLVGVLIAVATWLVTGRFASQAETQDDAIEDDADTDAGRQS